MRGRQALLLDVREPWEFGICHIEGSVPMPMGSVPARFAELDRDAEIVVVCHHGGRSAQVCMFLEHQGFGNVINLAGGVAGWATRSTRRCRSTDAAAFPEDVMKRAIALCGQACSRAARGPPTSCRSIEEALANDAKFSAARAEFEAGQEKVVQGRSGLLPQIGLNAETRWNDAELRTSSSPRAMDYSYNSNGYGVQLTQPLFRWQNWVQFKQGELQTALTPRRSSAWRGRTWCCGSPRPTSTFSMRRMRLLR